MGLGLVFELLDHERQVQHDVALGERLLEVGRANVRADRGELRVRDSGWATGYPDDRVHLGILEQPRENRGREVTGGSGDRDTHAAVALTHEGSSATASMICSVAVDRCSSVCVAITHRRSMAPDFGTAGCKAALVKMPRS